MRCSECDEDLALDYVPPEDIAGQPIPLCAVCDLSLLHWREANLRGDEYQPYGSNNILRFKPLTTMSKVRELEREASLRVRWWRFKRLVKGLLYRFDDGVTLWPAYAMVAIIVLYVACEVVPKGLH